MSIAVYKIHSVHFGINFSKQSKKAQKLLPASALFPFVQNSLTYLSLTYLNF